MAGWKEDARFVGAFMRGGNWEVGLRIARNVQVDRGRGGRPDVHSRTSTRISMVEFAREAGISDRTVRRYLAAWEWAANEGCVDASADVNPDTEYDWERSGLSQEDWNNFYRTAGENPPPWDPAGKPLEPRKYPERNVGRGQLTPTPAQVKDAWKSSKEVRDAVREAERETVTASRQKTDNAIEDMELRAMSSGGRVPSKEELTEGPYTAIDAAVDALGAEADCMEALDNSVELVNQLAKTIEVVVQYGRIPDNERCGEQLQRIVTGLNEILWSATALTSQEASK